MTELVSEVEAAPKPKWRPLNRVQRRVAGVLVEKAKTTPDAYPLSLNGLTTGCNQKSNRDPQMNLEPDQVEETLDQLREMGAVGEVQGSGRVPKYRHYLKEWLGVSGVELAVMAELLLRGAQTVGELRSRAARMAGGELPDLTALRPVLAGLIQRKLVVELTSEGRGQIVTHGLYQENEWEKVRRQASAAADVRASHSSEPAAVTLAANVSPASQTPNASVNDQEAQALREELAQLRDEMGRLRKEIEDIWASLK
jgi:uncharacterized protein YceH (UPF0502 family)